MVIIIKPGTSQNEIRKLAAKFEADNFKVGITTGVDCSILGLVGDTSNIAYGIFKFRVRDPVIVSRLDSVSCELGEAQRTAAGYVHLQCAAVLRPVTQHSGQCRRDIFPSCLYGLSLKSQQISVSGGSSR